MIKNYSLLDEFVEFLEDLTTKYEDDPNRNIFVQEQYEQAIKLLDTYYASMGSKEEVWPIEEERIGDITEGYEEHE